MFVCVCLLYRCLCACVRDPIGEHASTFRYRQHFFGWLLLFFVIGVKTSNIARGKKNTLFGGNFRLAPGI